MFSHALVYIQKYNKLHPDSPLVIFRIDMVENSNI